MRWGLETQGDPEGQIAGQDQQIPKAVEYGHHNQRLGKRNQR